ncbi:4Fe-4S dicluster protein [Ruminiclostridium sufflavum DSM 19573]|uniref:Ferredoxin n=1 Tax=Ruminiclostridium sufflavum DSM 19573 TaxID=1121337 RepID=A0A318XRT7_9FIRM|nr:4Fe-4S binding protein [Ruminiclostridium sufflavum]PYG90389.1 4Fe-4S dicluster protein [Ruminiclostridium sufflavum DSM 19573]
MAYHIGTDCISCGLCESECPVCAISKGEAQYKIDAEICIDCGLCESKCPVSTISE